MMLKIFPWAVGYGHFLCYFYMLKIFVGSMPYDGMIEEDIKAFVKEGNTLEKISSCPINV